MQLVIFPGDPYVFATHEDAQDLTDLYGALDLPTEDGGRYERPAAAIVPWPSDRSLPRDADGRIPDPRQVAPPEG